MKYRILYLIKTAPLGIDIPHPNNIIYLIPPNTTASLYLSPNGKICERGKLLGPDNEFISETINSAERIISLQSDIYNFEIKN